MARPRAPACAHAIGWVLACALGLGLVTHLRAAQVAEVFVGSVTTVHVGPVARVAVGNQAVVQASVVEDGNIILLGMAAGVSEVTIWTEAGARVEYLVRVYAQPQQDRLAVIESVFALFPEVEIKRRLGTVILTGTVDAAVFERFDELVTEFEQVISLVQPQLNVQIQPSVVLDVTMLELSRSYQQTLGVRWQDTAPGLAFGVVGNIIPNDDIGVVAPVDDVGQLRTLLSAVGPGSSTLSSYFGITSIIGSQLQLLEQEGVARVLAAPSLSTVSGEQATFLAGGDFPVAILNRFGQPVVEFREFGIQLDILPVVDRHNNIRATIRVERSRLDFSIQVNGVPGLRRRETVSTITARPGETIIISGLYNASDSSAIDSVPGLGDIPILGALFSSKDYQQMRTELVVTVTPRIQEPNTPLTEEFQRAERALRAPLEGSEALDRALVR